MMTTTKRAARYAKAMHASTCAVQGPPCPVDGNLAWVVWGEAAVAVADDELAAIRKDRDVYKDAFKDAAMANTVAAKNLAEQEAKTVEYRAAWIRAQRERDDARKQLRHARAGLRELTEGLCDCGDESCQESAWRIAIGAVTE